MEKLEDLRYKIYKIFFVPYFNLIKGFVFANHAFILWWFFLNDNSLSLKETRFKQDYEYLYCVLNGFKG